MYRFLVFFAGFGLMLVELVAARVAAPHLGASLITWTSVIGVVLIAMTLGNCVGGRWADADKPREKIGWGFLGAGISLFIANEMAAHASQVLDGSFFGLWPRIFMFSFLAFFLPAFWFSVLPPLLVKLDARKIEGIGRAFGTLGAWQAVGSLVGTFAGGFFFISLFGTKWLFTTLGIACGALGVWLMREKRPWRHALAWAVLPLVAFDFIVPKFCTAETNYYCIRVTQEEKDGTSRYVLRLDHLVHSYIDPAHPERLGYDYERVYQELVGMQHATSDGFFAFFIGGGGYAFPRYLEAAYPHATLTVAEIDPGVTRMNFTQLHLATSTRIVSENMDARMFVRTRGDHAPYQYVFGDAFNDFSVPYHLTTVEFHRELKKRMTPDGVYALNVIDDARYGHFLASMIRTLREVWSHVYLAPLNDSIKTGRNTFVLIATDAPIDAEEWTRHVSARERPESLLLLPEEQVNAFLEKHPAPALTDDFAPVDRYLSPVFQDAY